MKISNGLSYLGLLLSSNVFALPVLNLNAPGAEEVTVFPDHLDHNLFYLAPTVMLVAQDENGLPQFSYLEYGALFQQKGAVIQTTMRAHFPVEAIETVKHRILTQNPAAQFTGLPFTASHVIFSDRTLLPLVMDSSCDHPAGLVGDEESCSFRLSERGRAVLRPMLKQGLALTMQLAFSIDGVIQGADGKYTSQANGYEVAGRIGGPELAQHPELFRDRNGWPIRGLLETID